MSPKWFITRIIAYPIAAILGIKTIGREKVKRKGPMIIAANHRSYLDPPLIGYAVGRECFFMAKKSLFEVAKFFTWLITFYNAFPITPLNAIRKAREVLSHGLALVIFPEGTRSKTDAMLAFHPGVGYLARKFQAPVLPIYIENSRKPLWQIISRRCRLRIIFGEIIKPPPVDCSSEMETSFVAELRNNLIQLGQVLKK